MGVTPMGNQLKMRHDKTRQDEMVIGKLSNPR